MPGKAITQLVGILTQPIMAVQAIIPPKKLLPILLLCMGINACVHKCNVGVWRGVPLGHVAETLL